MILAFFVSIAAIVLLVAAPAAPPSYVVVRKYTVVGPTPAEDAAFSTAGRTRLDPQADRVLSAQLTRSELSTFGSNSRGALGARFRVTQKSAIIFEKQVTVEEEWPSAFLGAVAITDASNHYTGLYPKLWAALLADPEFRAAAR